MIHVIHRHGMDEMTAYEVEAALIDASPTVTNIMGGQHSNDYGPMHVKEIINKYSSSEIEFNHNVIMINVNYSLTERSLYEATRFAWRISKSRAMKADYVLAVKKGIVIGVFKPDKWLIASKDNFPLLEEDELNRYGFEGSVAKQEVYNHYIGKRVPDSYRRKGSSNPIRYSY